jgi:predicted O-linked N-acetylglucosamine transferase (SPINDLY family)
VPQTLFSRALLLQAQGRLEEALADYEAAAAIEPGFAGAVNNHAVVLQALGRHEQALESFARLLALAPDHAPAQLARGRSFEALGRAQEASAAYTLALQLQPDYADARLAQARLLRAQGEVEAALALCLAAATTPGADAATRIQAWMEHGDSLQARQAHEAALESYAQVLALQPGMAAAHNNRALSLLALGRMSEALAAAAQAAAAQPALPEAQLTLGLAHAALEQHEEALASYRRALDLRPDYTDALVNSAHELEVLGRLPEALACHDRGLALAPDSTAFLYGRGAVLQMMERHAEALVCYERVLQSEPAHVEALSNRAWALRKLGRAQEAASAYAHLLALAPGRAYAAGDLLHMQLQGCEWSSYGAAQRIEEEIAAGRPADSPFQFLSVSASASLQLQCARMHAARTFAPSRALWCGEPYTHDRIRVAYVTPDLSFHPVSYLTAALFEDHDRARFEISAVSLRPLGNGGFDRRMRAAFEHFIDASALSDLDIARLIRAREIDIAVDLMGYTSVPRAGIYMHRAAPVQAAWLGYAGTLGSGHMDYLIADAVAIPPGSVRHYAEQVVHLPGTFMPRDPTLPAGVASTRAAAGLPAQGFVFCCFNNSYKLNPPVFDVWMRLLRQVPDSVLWLSEPAARARENLLREAAARGVAPQRLVFAPRTAAIADHVARIALADLFLDTLPYNAHTTASDALWAGVPVLTCAGEAMASRVAASLLREAGLDGLITSNLADYEALAVRLAREPGQLAALRHELAQRRASGELFNAARLCRHLESAFGIMHGRRRQGLAPAGFAVAP